MKKLLVIIFFLLSASPAYAYKYNEPHTFQSELESARSKTVQIVLINEHRYPWATTSEITSTGTGTLLDDGYILTNEHVISGDHTEIVINTYDKQRYSATLITSSPKLDLALLHINSNSKGFVLSDIEPYAGESIMTVGQPAGLPSWSFAEGTIQKVDQPATMTTGESYTAIMTDAEVKQGNSGGPLINDRGELVGIVRAANVGHSFAVPLSDIKSFLVSKEHPFGYNTDKRKVPEDHNG